MSEASHADVTTHGTFDHTSRNVDCLRLAVTWLSHGLGGLLMADESKCTEPLPNQDSRNP